jgi:aminoglycoside phosphotransferase (APT) family kinase protein
MDWIIDIPGREWRAVSYISETDCAIPLVNVRIISFNGGQMAVRAGDEVDLQLLNRFLAECAPAVGQIVAVDQFPGGFSNLTYLLTSTSGAECVLRRPPRGVEKGPAHDMAREYRILGALMGAGVAAPHPIALCEDPAVLGSPFYIMERVTGLILRGGVTDAPGPAVMRRLSENFVETLTRIHQVDARDPAVAALGRGGGYVARQVTGWTSRWEKSRTGDVPDMDSVARWLAAKQPDDSGACLVHNDYKYDNLVLRSDDPAEIVAVLDWEMATLGDPLLDVGVALAYWVEANDHPAFRALGLGATALPGNFTRQELWDRYLAGTGRKNVSPAFYCVFGLFKVAVIAQQIYARYQKGLTVDARFARLGDAVTLMAKVAASACASGSISITNRDHT